MTPKICLLVVEDRPQVYLEYAKWLIKVIAEGQLYQVFFWNDIKKPIWHIRKSLIEDALKTDCNHILFVDTDTIPPEGFIDKLLSHNLDMVSGIYYDILRQPISSKDGKRFQGEGLEEVDTCSIGASLIKREVLEKVKYPKPAKETVDADIEFCVKVKENGFKVFQDFDLICGHIQLDLISNIKL